MPASTAPAAASSTISPAVPAKATRRTSVRSRELNSGEDKTTLSDLRSTSWEAGDGKSYRFKIDTRMNDGDASAVDGMAEREGDHVTVKLKQPVAKTFTLEGSTVFPTEQIHRIIAAAREGKSVLELNVYDGSDTRRESLQHAHGDRAGDPRRSQGRATPDPSTGDEAMKNADALAGDRQLLRQVGASRSDGGEQTPVYADVVRTV